MSKREVIERFWSLPPGDLLKRLETTPSRLTHVNET